MRRANFSALTLAFLTGCSEEPATPVAGPTPAPNVAPASPAGDTVAPPQSLAVSPPTVSYPESREVQALLYRARELRDAGQFHEAFAVADQALARDPNSPAAAALRGELWAVVTKI